MRAPVKHGGDLKLLPQHPHLGDVRVPHLMGSLGIEQRAVVHLHRRLSPRPGIRLNQLLLEDPSHRRPADPDPRPDHLPRDGPRAESFSGHILRISWTVRRTP